MVLTPLDFCIRATDALVKFDANFASLRDDDLDIYSLEIQGNEARELWSKVKEMFDKCLNYLQKVNFSIQRIKFLHISSSVLENYLLLLNL